MGISGSGITTAKPAQAAPTIGISGSGAKSKGISGSG
jgi:hypothetical protein